MALVLPAELSIMHRLCHRVRMRPPSTLFAAAFIAALLCTAPAIATEVYHSPNDDGQPAVGPPSVPAGGLQPVYLYIDGGVSASAGGTAW